jgi:hypothetical protein
MKKLYFNAEESDPENCYTLDMPISPVFELLKEFQSHLLMDEIKRRKKIRKNFNH